MFSLDKMYLVFISLGICVAVFACGFYIGQKITGDYYRLEIKQIENTGLKFENEYLVKKINTESELKNKVNEVLSNGKEEKQNIENAYNASISLFDSGMHSDGNNTNEMQLSDNANVTAGTRSDRANKCDIRYNADFKRLSEKLLKKAKEYDLLKVRYNTLLSLWKESEIKINNY